MMNPGDFYRIAGFTVETQTFIPLEDLGLKGCFYFTN